MYFPDPSRYSLESEERSTSALSACVAGTGDSSRRLARLSAYFTTISLKEYPLKAVSKALGHANTKVTTEVYQHIDIEGIGAPLAGMSSKLLASVSKSIESTG
jgi:integrase